MQNGYRVFVTNEDKMTLEQVSSQMGIAVDDLLEYNAPYYAKLSATTKLPEESKLYCKSARIPKSSRRCRWLRPRSTRPPRLKRT